MILVDKSYKFALTTCEELLKIQKAEREYNLTNQLIRSSTSIAANIKEAQGCQSRRDFLAKISIAYKECLESEFGINLMSDLNLFSKDKSEDLKTKCDELIRITGKIKSTTRKNLNQ